MIERQITATLRDRIRRFPAVALLGPRQSGKTTLALALADEFGEGAVYLDLELPSDRAKISDPELYLSSNEGQLVILDEIHRAPDLFQVLRSIIDRRRRKGIRSAQFLLLGSASIDLLKQSSESLAGRISYLHLTPFTVQEVAAHREGATDQLWVRGGFPDSFLADSDADSFEWREAFIQTYLERDIPALGPRIPTETLHRFWQMLAHNQAQLWNGARLAAGLGVSGQTVARYLDTMVDLLLARRLPPWMPNLAKRLVRAPKVYVRDSGLVHALLGIRDREHLFGHPVVGGSWEGMMVENILLAAPAGSNGWFYRTASGAEIDLIIESGGLCQWAIEIKRSLSSPQPGKGFHLACEDVKAKRRVVIYPGKERFRIDALTEVMPIGTLLAELAN